MRAFELGLKESLLLGLSIVSMAASQAVKSVLTDCSICYEPVHELMFVCLLHLFTRAD